jgi:DNA-binding NarL/FixJ family response regulator
VDDHALVRSGIRALLESEPGFAVVGEAADGCAALRLARETAPGVVLMDLSMQGMNGFEATRRLTAELPALKVVCVSMYTERPFVTAALRGGASGYVLKSSAVDELLTAVRTVAAGQVYLSPAVGAAVLAELRAPRGPSRGAPASAFELLTPREREVLQLLAEGLSSKQIAGRLEVSAKTVGTYRERLMGTLAIDSVAGLTRYAIAQGLTPPPNA